MTIGDLHPTEELEETAFFENPPEAEGTDGLVDRLVGREFDSYAIEAFVGKGGMAHVFRAQHKSLQRPCAIKVLSPQLLGRDPGFLDMFLAEARAAASVVHPNIVTVHNIGETEHLHYIELEYVAGHSLQHLAQQQGRLSVEQATDLLTQACAGLAEAHRRGLVHRDFKPSNILVTDYGAAKLSDFGLAKRLERDRSGEKLAGTPYYMAPELFAGTRANPASDVYAVGISYFFLLTGAFPYLDRNVTELAHKHEAEPIPDPRQYDVQVPADAIDLLYRCLAKRPQDRPADGGELLERIQAIRRAIRSLPALVREALAGTDCEIRERGSAIEVRVSLPGGRSQRVTIEETDDALGSDRVVKIFSRCCELREDYFRRALEMNAQLCHGSLAIEVQEDRPWFVMVEAYPRGTCDPEEIRHSVLDIARWSDEVEHTLTGQDVY
jgi:serine/threonine-protein kinase